MNELFETIAVLIALSSILGVLFMFFVFMRAVGRKEQQTLDAYQRGDFDE